MRLTANEVRSQILRRFKSSRLRREIIPALLGRDYLFVRNQAREDLGGSRANSTTDGSSRLRKQEELRSYPELFHTNRNFFRGLDSLYHFIKRQNVKYAFTSEIDTQNKFMIFLANSGAENFCGRLCISTDRERS